MEMELNTIIEKIKQEGIGEAEKKAAGILDEARKKADELVKEGEKKKEEVVKKAEKEAERIKKNGEEALRQASRDVLLGLRENIVALFDGIIKKEIARQMSPDVLKEVLVKLIESFAKEKQFEVEVLLSEKDKKSMEKTLLSALKEDLKKGVTLKVSPSIEHGFRIGRKGEHSYYDFTDEAVAESFKTYLNPKVTELLS